MDILYKMLNGIRCYAFNSFNQINDYTIRLFILLEANKKLLKRQ